MMKKNNQNPDHAGRPYEKPKLRVIELAAEEVLMAGCKVSTFGSTAFGSMTNCISNGCAGVGS